MLQVVQMLDVIIVVDCVFNDVRGTQFTRVQRQFGKAGRGFAVTEDRVTEIPDGERFVQILLNIWLIRQL